MGEFESRSVKTQDVVEGFHLLKNSHKLCREFHQALKAWRTCFIFFKIIIFGFNKEKHDIRSAYVLFKFFNDTVNSHSEIANHIADVIFVFHNLVKNHL